MQQDVRYALRTLAMRPVTASVTIAVLAIAIAGSVVTFSLADAILWHPVPFSDPDRLVQIRGYHPAQPNQISVSISVLEGWKGRDQVVSAVHVWSPSSSIIEVGGRTEAVSIARFTPGLITELGVSVYGRDFEAGDVGQRVAILREDFARLHFQNPDEALGQPIRIDGEPHIVVGIAPRGLAFPLKTTSAWLPPSAGPTPARVRAIARIRENLTFAHAAELAAATSRSVIGQTELRLAPLASATAGTSQAIVVMIAAMLCLLFVGVANASNLLLAETVRRGGELVVRRALGASSFALVRLVVVESATRSILAAGVALLVALALLDGIASGIPRILTYRALRPIALDWRTLAFGGAISAITACIVAIVPCFRILRGDVRAGLQASAPASTPRSRIGDVLTVVQLVATLMLLAAAGVLVNGFVRLLHVNPGYDADGVTSVMLRLPSMRFSDRAVTEVKLQALASEAMSVPGVTAASIADGMPPYMSFQAAGGIETADGAPLDGSDLPVGFAFVDDKYFSTLRIPLFARAGSAAFEGAESVVVTRSLAERLWPGREAVGRRFRLSASEPWLTVTRLAGDVRLGGFDQPLGTLPCS